MNNVRNGDFQLDPAYGPSDDGGGSGGVDSIVAGQSMTVDNTDPLNPVISLGTTSEFPGVVIVPGATFVGQSASNGILATDTGLIVNSLGGGFTLFTADGAVLTVGADGKVSLNSIIPLLIPHTEDGGASLDPTAYRGSIIYDLTSDSVIYSNGTDWVHLIASVEAGTGIAVDDSQPAHPIVSVSP